MTRPKRSPAEPPPSSARARISRWLSLAAGFLGAVFGLATNLYSAEFRRALEVSEQGVTRAVLSAAVTAIVASGTTAMIYRWLVRRRPPNGIVQGRLAIRTDALRFVESDKDFVVGRALHYLEAKRETPELVVFLHGLGLDANDFRPYMAESRFHCVGLTLYGFNNEEKDDQHYRPISLRSHVGLIAYALLALHRQYPGKRITLVGFSFGADMILFLNENAPEIFRSAPIHRAVLLDPNVSNRTTTISSRIATVDRASPDQLVKLLETAGTVEEWRYLCEYLYKITAKDFAQIQRHAREVVSRYATDSDAPFLNRLGDLRNQVPGGVHVTLSFHFQDLFNSVAKGAATHNLEADSVDLSQGGHFELIEAGFLKVRLEGAL